ncbi:MAG: DUF3494 domain-containing protein, partial [Ferruginibacter sp.]|nr:DUF3494 domain-containing protein [Ferruginibacter sp.]
MKTKFLLCVAAITLTLFPILNFAQAPNLGTCSTFALFTAAGAFSNDGATVVTGDIGTNVGAFTGFPPGIVYGSIHVANGISAQAAADVDVAYSYLDNLTCGLVIGTTLGNGQSLTPNIYCLGAASTLNGDLVLDGGGDPSSIFVFEIDGALSTTTLSTVTLINSASLCNVYWQVNGAVSLGEGSVFQGTIIANGAISLLEASALYGRALSRGGAIDMHNNVVNVPTSPVASTISSNGGATTFCEGDSVILTGNVGGVWNNGDTASSITVFTGGDYFVTNTTNCGSETSNHIIVTVTSCSSVCTAPVVSSIDSVC